MTLSCDQAKFLSNFIWFTEENEDIPDTVKSSVHALVLGANSSYYSPPEFIMELPFFNVLSSEAQASCRLTKLYFKTLDDEPLLLFGLCCSSAGRSYYKSVSIDVNGSEKQVDVILIDVRVIYESLVVCLATPFTQTNFNVDEPLAFIRLALATRLNSSQNSSLNKIILGLTAAARDEFAESAQFGTSRSLKQLIQSSDLTNEQIILLTQLICRFVMLHEVSHLLFNRIADLKEQHDQIFTNIATSFADEIAHLQEHDQETLQILERLGISSSNQACADEIISIWHKCADDSNSIFSKGDREELTADLFAIINTIDSFSSQAPDNPETVILTTLAMRGCHEVITMLTGRKCALYWITETVKIEERLAENDSAESTRNAAMKELSKSIDKASSVKSGRSYFFVKVLQGACQQFLEKGNSELIQDEEARKKIEELGDFMIALQHQVEFKCYSYEGVIRHSSRGRAIEWFIDRTDKPLQKETDPFFLYVHDKAPL